MIVVYALCAAVASAETPHSSGSTNGSRQSVFSDTLSETPVSPNPCGPRLSEPVTAANPTPAVADAPRPATSNETKDREPSAKWFCSSPLSENCIVGWNDGRPNPKLFHEYAFNTKDKDEDVPEDAILVQKKTEDKNVDVELEEGSVKFDEAEGKVSMLIFKINGKHTYEIEDPFSSKAGLDASLLRQPGELKSDGRAAVLEYLKAHNLDISRVESLELKGFISKPLELEPLK